MIEARNRRRSGLLAAALVLLAGTAAWGAADKVVLVEEFGATW